MCVSNFAGASHFALCFRIVGAVPLMGVPTSLAQFVLSVHRRKRLSVISGRCRETGAIEPFDAKELRDDVLESLKKAYQS
jgi:hypothetical protein